MENKIFRKSISIDRVFYGFDLEIGLHFYFYYKPFPGPRRAKRGRGREKEERVTDPPKTDCTPAPVPAYISHHHRDRITTEDRSTQTDPPKIASPQTDRTPLRSHHHRRPIHPKPISSAPSSRSRRPWPMTDLSLSLHFLSLSLPRSLSLTKWWSLTNCVVLIFVF